MEDFGLKEFPTVEELASIRKLYPNLDEYSVLIILRYLSISKEITKSYNHFFDYYGLTDAKFSVLMILYRAPNKTLYPYEIAEQSGYCIHKQGRLRKINLKLNILILKTI